MDVSWPLVVFFLGITLIWNLESIVAAYRGKPEETADEDEEYEEDEYNIGFSEAAGMLLSGCTPEYVYGCLEKQGDTLRYEAGVNAAIGRWKSVVKTEEHSS